MSFITLFTFKLIKINKQFIIALMEGIFYTLRKYFILKNILIIVIAVSE